MKKINAPEINLVTLQVRDIMTNGSLRMLGPADQSEVYISARSYEDYDE